MHYLLNLMSNKSVWFKTVEVSTVSCVDAQVKMCISGHTGLFIHSLNVQEHLSKKGVEVETVKL